MQVYTYEGAPNPQRLAMFMKYKGIELETHVVDMAAQEQLTDAYRAINPDATVPCLVLDDGEVISQVIGMWALALIRVGSTKKPGRSILLPP